MTDLDMDDPTKSPKFGGIIDSGGRYYPPDPEIEARQKKYFKHAIYWGLRLLLYRDVTCLSDDQVSALDRVEDAAGMLVAYPHDPKCLALAGRVGAFLRVARERGEDDSNVRAEAKELMTELEEYRFVMWWPPGMSGPRRLALFR